MKGVNNVNSPKKAAKEGESRKCCTVRNLILLKRRFGKLNGGGIWNKIHKCRLGGVAIEMRCGAGNFFEKTGSRAKIGVCGFFGGGITDRTKNGAVQHVVAVSWVSGECPRVSTSRFSGEIQAVFYGFDMTMILKGIMPELLF